MSHKARLLALIFFTGLTLHISAQPAKSIRALLQDTRDLGFVFTPVTLFEKAPATDASAARFAQGAQFLTLGDNRLAGLLNDRPKCISLVLPYREEQLLVDLVQVDILAADFSVISSAQENEPEFVRPGLHYRGILRGAEQSIAAFSFFDGDVMGVVSDDRHGNMVLGRVQNPGRDAGFILYSEHELAMDNPFECNLVETSGRAAQEHAPANRVETDKSLRMHLEASNSLFQNRGSVQSTFNYLSGIFNQVSALYANEQIGLVIAEMYIWDVPDGYTALTSNAVLDRFRHQRAGSKTELAHLVGLAGSDPESAAFLDVLCQPEYAVAYSNVNVSFSNVPTYSWSTEVIAHQIGHNLGSRHTQWCGWPGGAIDPSQLAERGCQPARETRSGTTIMSYCPLITSGINFSKGFGALPGGVIRSNVNATPCLASAKKVTRPAVEDRSNLNAGAVATFNLTPNPASRQVQIQLHFNDAFSNGRISLVDLVGHTIHTQAVSASDTSITLDLASLQKGVYLVHVFENEKLVATKRLIKN